MFVGYHAQEQFPNIFAHENPNLLSNGSCFLGATKGATDGCVGTLEKMRRRIWKDASRGRYPQYKLGKAPRESKLLAWWQLRRRAKLLRKWQLGRKPGRFLRQIELIPKRRDVIAALLSMGGKRERRREETEDFSLKTERRRAKPKISKDKMNVFDLSKNDSENCSRIFNEQLPFSSVGMKEEQQSNFHSNFKRRAKQRQNLEEGTKN